MKVIIDRAIPFIEGVLEPYAQVEYLDGSNIDHDVVKECDAMIIRTRTRCDAKLLEGSKVRLIATATIGTDHIDTKYCFEHGIIVANAHGCNARGVLQWMAAVLKDITSRDHRTPEEYTLGIVGVGSVGSLVKQYAEAWGFRVMACDPPKAKYLDEVFFSIEELARECDIITLHTPLDKSTHHLISRDIIAMMKPEATIINASRGAVADNRAVFDSSHRYYFDVWENEPEMELDILQRATIATPHIAGYSQQGKANATSMVIRAISSFFGFPLGGWYPSNIPPSAPREIAWNELCSTIDRYCPISEISQQLKSTPSEFEKMRNNYNYREEYF